MCQRKTPASSHHTSLILEERPHCPLAPDPESPCPGSVERTVSPARSAAAGILASSDHAPGGDPRRAQDRQVSVPLLHSSMALSTSPLAYTGQMSPVASPTCSASNRNA